MDRNPRPAVLPVAGNAPAASAAEPLPHDAAASPWSWVQVRTAPNRLPRRTGPSCAAAGRGRVGPEDGHGTRSPVAIAAQPSGCPFPGRNAVDDILAFARRRPPF